MPEDEYAKMSDEDTDGDNQTTSVQHRHWLTNDLLVGYLVVTFVGLVGAHGFNVIDLTTVPDVVMVAWVTIVLGASTWLVGVDLLDKWGSK